MRVQKVWGSEKWIVNSRLYCLKEMILYKNASCSLHFHPEKTETFYVIVGSMIIATTNGFTTLIPGDTFTIKAGLRHSFFGLESTTFFEVSTYHSDLDCARVTESKFPISEEEWKHTVRANLYAVGHFPETKGQTDGIKKME